MKLIKHPNVTKMFEVPYENDTQSITLFGCLLFAGKGSWQISLGVFFIKSFLCLCIGYGKQN